MFKTSLDYSAGLTHERGGYRDVFYSELSKGADSVSPVPPGVLTRQVLVPDRSVLMRIRSHSTSGSGITRTIKGSTDWAKSIPKLDRSKSASLPIAAIVDASPDVTVPYPDEILRRLSERASVKDLQPIYASLERWLSVPSARKSIKDKILQTNLDVKPIARRGLLELLYKADEQESLRLAVTCLSANIKEGVLDHLTVGCLSLLRRTKPEDTDPDAIGNLLREILDISNPMSVVSDLFSRKVLREVILALGSYGTTSDIDRLLELLEQDIDYKYGDAAVFSVSSIMMMSPKSIPRATVRRLRKLGKSLLACWTDPRVLGQLQTFAQASQVVSMLCARLDPGDLTIAYKAVKAADDQALAFRMLQHMELAQDSLAARGHTEWIARYTGKNEKLRKRLSALAHPSK